MSRLEAERRRAIEECDVCMGGVFVLVMYEGMEESMTMEEE